MSEPESGSAGGNLKMRGPGIGVPVPSLFSRERSKSKRIPSALRFAMKTFILWPDGDRNKEER